MVDISFLVSSTKGDLSKMKRYIQLYLDISPGIFQQMRMNLEEKNWELLRINAHSLKPQVDYMGVPELKECLVQMEGDIVEQNYANLNKLYDKACRLHKESTILLKKHLEKL